MRFILFIIVIILLLGALPTWPYSGGWGYYPSGGLGVVLIILIILLLMDASRTQTSGRLRRTERRGLPLLFQDIRE